MLLMALNNNCMGRDGAAASVYVQKLNAFQSNRGIGEVVVAVTIAVVAVAEAVGGIDDSRSTASQIGLSAATTAALPVAGEGGCSSKVIRP
jgi:hypothetical protein